MFNKHDKAEDDIFYPALKEFSELDRLVRKDQQAHHVVEVALELRLLPYMSDSWGPKFSVVTDSVICHMAEERKKVFPQALNFLDENKLNELGADIQEQRNL